MGVLKTGFIYRLKCFDMGRKKFISYLTICFFIGLSSVLFADPDIENSDFTKSFSELRNSLNVNKNVIISPKHELAMCYRARAWNAIKKKELWRFEELMKKSSWDVYDKNTIKTMFSNYMGPVLSYVFRDVHPTPAYADFVEENNLAVQECPLTVSYLAYYHLDSVEISIKTKRDFIDNAYDCQSTNITLSTDEVKLCRCMVLDINCDNLPPKLAVLTK